MRVGFSRIIAATALAGVAAYVITWLVPRVSGFESYAVFSVFWGVLFFSVSALSGIQQEVTRSTLVRTGPSADRGASAIRFGAAVALVVGVVFAATGPLWANALFPGHGMLLVWPIAVGAASYVVIAVIAGSLYGLEAWGPLFWLLTLEAVLRLALIGAALAIGADVVLLAWAVAVPFPLVVIVLSPTLRRRIRGRVEMDGDYRTITANVLRTVLAAASMGALISGMPFILGATAGDVDSAVFGLVVVTMTLTRAPLIVVVMALQSYLIVLFKSTEHWWRLYLRLAALVIVGGGILALLGYLLGPWVFSVLFPDEATPQSSVIALMVLSSALVGLLCLSAPAVLALGAHWVYSAGWAVSAAATLGVLLTPLPFVERTLLALCVGPLFGLAVHSVYLAVARRRPVSVPA